MLQKQKILKKHMKTLKTAAVRRLLKIPMMILKIQRTVGKVPIQSISMQIPRNISINIMSSVKRQRKMAKMLIFVLWICRMG